MFDLAILYLIGYLTTVIVMNYNMYGDNENWTALAIFGWMLISIGLWWLIAFMWLWAQAATLVVYSKKYK